MPNAREDFELLKRALVEPRQKDFPDAARAEAAHGEYVPVPGVEVADDADAFRVRRPDAEMHAADAGNLANVRAQFFVFELVRALAGEI